ncbi:MAG: DNA/RNA non-specific endonuclease [Alistipes sp.]|nr:DNA/RNA non-specific endonuclease [Alistipes sp.]
MKKFYHICAVLLSLTFVACFAPEDGGDSTATYLKVSPSEITYDSGSDNFFVVDTDGAWEITAPEKLKLTAVRGEAGLSTVRIVEMTSSSTQTIVVRTPSNLSLVQIVKVKSSNQSPTPDPNPNRNYNWAETPKKSNSKADYVYHTHWSTTYSSNKRVRNYSYCYDVRRHSPIWIAHPQHAIYQEGGKTRPASDPWACDPYLTDSQSAIIYPLYGANNCSLRTYFDNYYQEFYQWQRGHMLASSYRGCGDKSNPAEINKQTFYSANIAAQRSDQNSAFQILWGTAEKKILDSYVCSDTLYVVSGAHFANENTKATDGNMFYIPDYCKTCVVPTHFYKILLRTKSGRTGKAIQECSASELKAVGFWFSNTDTDEQTGSTSPTLSKVHMRSIDDIERLTGNEFNFFPEIPESVEASFNASEWGF